LSPIALVIHVNAQRVVIWLDIEKLQVTDVSLKEIEGRSIDEEYFLTSMRSEDGMDLAITADRLTARAGPPVTVRAYAGTAPPLLAIRAMRRR
jgi:hypothetical protein